MERFNRESCAVKSYRRKSGKDEGYRGGGGTKKGLTFYSFATTRINTNKKRVNRATYFFSRGKVLRFDWVYTSYFKNEQLENDSFRSEEKKNKNQQK